MRKEFERPFELLRRVDGSAYEKETIDRWYKARAFVLGRLNEIVIGPESNEFLHVVVMDDTPLMLSVVRQVALSAHYTNYDERTRTNRSVITLVSDNEDIVNELKKEEYLSNLLDFCKYTFNGIIHNEDSYIDVELDIVNTWEGGDDCAIVIKEEDVNDFVNGERSKKKHDIDGIDTRKAILATRLYHLGELIDNLPAEDIHCARRYAMALDVFQHNLLKGAIEENLFNEGDNIVQVKNKLSNVFCTDCFESRKHGIDQYMKKNKKKNEKEAWEENNEALSMSEHERWVVEKLIMGFRPLNGQEMLLDEQLFGSAKKQYRNRLKKDPKKMAHIDLCSYAELRRVNPEDLKYDSFLMLAIPIILKKLNK